MTKTVGLVACSKSKRGESEPERTFPARDLYDSWLFDGRVRAVEAHCEQWAIFSAEHGYVEPDDELSWYDRRITELAPDERRDLAREVVDHLPETDRLLILMGRDYARPLKAVLPTEIDVWDPLEGVQLFDQRAELRDLASNTEQQRLPTATDGGYNSSTTDVSEEFTPVNVCRGCRQPTPQCICSGARCPSCHGKGYTVACIDDLCHAQEQCMHGDNAHCSECDGVGTVPPQRVLVVPDRDAYAIREYLRDHPELRKGEYVNERSDADPLAGLCYPAAEVYYHLQECEPDIYCLSWSDVDPDYSGTHWYLREPDDGRWIDITLSTMPPVRLPPFAEGRRRGFITGDEPSERAQQVLAGIEEGDRS